MGYIYKITNDINDKIYVGQTTRSVESRWRKHTAPSTINNIDSHIYRAFRKYGVEHFKVEEIEECDNNLLDERETFWIKQYDSYYHGYNETLGGSAGCKLEYDKIDELYEEGYDIGIIANILGYKRNSVYYALKEREGFREALNKARYDKMSIVVSQYDLYGNYIATFPSIQEAGRQMGFGKSTLSSNMSSGYCVCGGYQWRHGDNKDNIGIAQGNRRNIVKCTKDGEFICVYPSLAEAEKDTGVDHSNISKGCRKGYCYGGFKWIYYDDWLKQQVS